MAISVDAEIMDEEGRAALLDFFSEVFGWIEGDNSTEKGNPLILYTGSLGQFLYLLPAKDEFMVTPNMDHFGMEVSSKEEMLEILDRVKAYQSKDDRVRVTDVGAMVTRYQDKEYTLTNAYIWFLIPLWIELQHVERLAGIPDDDRDLHRGERQGQAQVALRAGRDGGAEGRALTRRPVAADRHRRRSMPRSPSPALLPRP